MFNNCDTLWQASTMCIWFTQLNRLNEPKLFWGIESRVEAMGIVRYCFNVPSEDELFASLALCLANIVL